MDATPVTFHLTSDDAQYVELCLARRRERLALSDTAPDGRVLAQCENATASIARQYACELLTSAMTRRVVAAEKKGGRAAHASAADRARVGARTSDAS